MTEFSGVDNNTTVASPTGSLVERARLSDKETVTPEPTRGHPWVQPWETYMRQQCDSATTKALHAVADWLEGWKYLSGGPGPLYGAGWEALREFLLVDLKKQLETAGLERPE